MSLTVGNMYRFGNHSSARDEDGNPTRAFEVLAPDGVTWIPTNPTTVTLLIEKPNRTVLRFGWPNPDTDGVLLQQPGADGRFYIDYTLDVEGVWKQFISSTGDVTASSESRVYVAGSGIAA